MTNFSLEENAPEGWVGVPYCGIIWSSDPSLPVSCSSWLLKRWATTTDLNFNSAAHQCSTRVPRARRKPASPAHRNRTSRTSLVTGICFTLAMASSELWECKFVGLHCSTRLHVSATCQRSGDHVSFWDVTAYFNPHLWWSDYCVLTSSFLGLGACSFLFILLYIMLEKVPVASRRTGSLIMSPLES